MSQFNRGSNLRPYSRNNTIFLGVLISVIIIPKIRLTSDYTFGLDDFISIGLFIHALIYSLNVQDDLLKKLNNYFYIIILTGFLSHIYGNYVYLSTFSLPGEMIQYIKRFVFLVLAYKYTHRVQSYNGVDKIIKFMAAVYAFALLVGLLQWLGVEELANLYGRSEKQSAVALRAGNDFKMIGTAGMTTSWGVLCAFFYVYFASMILAYKHNRKQIYVVLLIISVLFSLNTVSRSAYISIAFVTLYLLKIYLFSRYQIGVKLKKSDPVIKLIRVIFIVPLFIIVVFVLVGEAKFGDILHRFEYSTPGVGSQQLEENSRFAEVKSSIDALNAYPGGYVFGLGRLFSSEHTEHIEVEPFYLLSVYGIFGLMIRVLLLITIYKQARTLFKSSQSKTLTLFSLIVLIATPMYFIASIGLAFWHEQVAGTPYWIAVGMLLALRNSDSS